MHEFEIDAPVDAVWAALTNAEELTKWFPFAARVDPGNEIARQEIEIWEPGKHLRGHTGEQVIDWTLESANGRTAVRLVHSGFDITTRARRTAGRLRRRR